MSQKVVKKAISNIVADEHYWIYKVTYKDGKTEMYNLATMPPGIINRKFSKITTDDPKVYILYPVE